MLWLGYSFGLLAAIAGGYYLCISQGSHILNGIEPPARKRARRVLRRVGGAIMVALGLAFVVLIGKTVNRIEGQAPTAVLAAFVSVLFLLPTLLGLAVVDLWLTQRTRADMRRHEE